MRVTYNAEFERRIRLCAIGCGGHAQRDIFPAFQYAPIDLVAVCDFDRDRAQTCARLWGAPAVYTDYREMLRQEQPAAVKDCSCSAMHPKSAPLASVCWTTIRLNGATCRMPWNYYESTKHTAGRMVNACRLPAIKAVPQGCWQHHREFCARKAIAWNLPDLNRP